MGNDAQRTHAEKGIPNLRSELWKYGETQARLERQQGAVERFSPASATVQGAAQRVLEVKTLLDRATSTLRSAEILARGPEQALELAVRRASRTAVQTAASLLPSPLQIPVRLVLRAAERALDLGQDLGR